MELEPSLPGAKAGRRRRRQRASLIQPFSDATSNTNTNGDNDRIEKSAWPMKAALQMHIVSSPSSYRLRYNHRGAD